VEPKTHEEWRVFLNDSLVCVSPTDSIRWAYRPGDRCILLLLVPKARFVIVDTITKMRLYEGAQADFVSMPSQ